MRLFSVAAFLSIARLATSQGIVGGSHASGNGDVYSITFTVALAGQVATTGGAYSGRQSLSSHHTLADGSRLIRPAPAETTIYRDSQGRLRTERPAFAGTPMNFSEVEILDPVAGFVYVLDSVHRLAHRVAVEVRAVPSAPAPCAESCMPLGTRVVSGVNLTGRRTSLTIYETSGAFDTHSASMVNEIWSDPRNNIDVIARYTSDHAENTFTLEDYSNGEPEAAMFRVPANYQIVDEPAGTFTIRLSK